VYETQIWAGSEAIPENKLLNVRQQMTYIKKKISYCPENRELENLYMILHRTKWEERKGNIRGEGRGIDVNKDEKNVPTE